jgi:hypothetical protein
MDDNNSSIDPDGTCITKAKCDILDPISIKKELGNKDVYSTDVKLAKCTHCGAKSWNIHGDTTTGYVLTESSSGVQLCLVRGPKAGGGDNKKTSRVKMIPCDSTMYPYTPLQLQFASASDIEAMSSPGARLIGAASDGDKKLVARLLKEESWM